RVLVKSRTPVPSGHIYDGLIASRVSCLFFFKDTATTEIYTLSLHDALPISAGRRARWTHRPGRGGRRRRGVSADRSEEHTSELQSHLNLVCRPLLENKK